MRGILKRWSFYLLCALILGCTLAFALPAAASGQVCNIKVVTDANPDYSDIGSLIHSATSNWGTPEEKFHEIGDLLLVVAVWARWLKINPEDALRAANRRFYERFTHIERRAREQGREISAMSMEEMDALWNEAKGK